MTPSMFAKVGPGHGSLVGQCSHHVMCCPPPGEFWQLPPHVPPGHSDTATHAVPSFVPPMQAAPHILFSCTVPLRLVVQSLRSTATVQSCPVPVRQQKGGFAIGSRLLPHFFLMSVSFCVSAATSFKCSFGSARQLPRVPPFSMHCSMKCSRLSR